MSTNKLLNWHKLSRDYLYNQDNQDEVLNVIDNGSHLLIWKP